jgi:hypothetical protein
MESPQNWPQKSNKYPYWGILNRPGQTARVRIPNYIAIGIDCQDDLSKSRLRINRNMIQADAGNRPLH